MSSQLLIIGREEVARHLTYEVCIPLMKRAMIALSRGETRQLLRQIIDLGDGAAFGVMPGAMAEGFGAKLISVNGENPARGLQSHQGIIALFDPDTGAPIAIVHAGEVTAIRTAAATAAATLALARPDARTLAILGTGEQALTHARALASARPLAEIRIWGRSPDRSRALAEDLERTLSLPCSPATTVEEAVEGSDIICAVTAASEPVLEGAWVTPGVHVNLVGSSRAGPREADDELIRKSRVFADHREGVLRQGAEILHAMETGLIGEAHVLGEIGEVMAGSIAGRTGASDITVYKSLGSIVQDLACSAWLVGAVGKGLLAPFG